MSNIAIIGGGISGLSAAHFLKDKYDVTIFEREQSVGGLIRCKRINGSLFHLCGGHVFNSKRQDVLDWFWSVFNKEDEFSLADRNSVVFMENGSEIPYPIENHAYLLEPDMQKSFISDLLSIASSSSPAPTNFEEFLKGMFGDTLYRIYFKPYNEKVWRRDLSHVPLSWLEGKLPMPSVEEIIFNNFNHIKEKSFVHSTFWYEKINGSQFIVEKLAQGLNIRLGVNVSKIQYQNGHWTINDESFDKVIFCGNLKDMPHIIQGIHLEQCDDIEKLEYHGTTAVFCEIDNNPYSWIYQPSSNHQSHRIICTGNFSPTNNSSVLPPDRITATVEFTDQISLEEIKENLSKLPLHPTYITHHYNQYTYPIQDNNTRALVQQLKADLSDYNFFFTGRFADWEYYNMDVAIGAAMDLCQQL